MQLDAIKRNVSYTFDEHRGIQQALQEMFNDARRRNEHESAANFKEVAALLGLVPPTTTPDTNDERGSFAGRG